MRFVGIDFFRFGMTMGGMDRGFWVWNLGIVYLPCRC